jgi:ATP-dependent helicase/nuclease subunit B
MNRLIAELAVVCRQRVTEEKWLLAPSNRVGHQWLLALSRAGGFAVNVHVHTLTNLALALAGPAFAEADLELISPRHATLIIDQILTRLRPRALGFSENLASASGLARAVFTSIDALRQADIGAGALVPSHFEVGDKGKALAEVFAAYVEILAKKKLIDRSGLFRLAISRLADDPTVLTPETLLLVPQFLERTGLEKRLVEAIPASNRVLLAEDEPGSDPHPSAPAPNDAGRLRWLSDSRNAPAPLRDGTAQVFRAVGSGNEVREVLRRCLLAGWALDEVEVLYSDKVPYLSLCYEMFAKLPDDDDDPEQLPVTFADGIPASYSRPGRALTAWVKWVRGNYSQASLVSMVREGLLEIPELKASGHGFSSLAKLLRPIPIGLGRERYLKVLDRVIAARVSRLKKSNVDSGPDGEAAPEMHHGLNRLAIIRGVIARLIAITPLESASPRDVLRAGEAFLQNLARHATKGDEYARKRLLEKVQSLSAWLQDDDGETGLDAWDWLAALPAETNVAGSAPREGCLHVASIYSGGHSGRAHTFIIGLDEARHPGAGLPDPILLDRERARISGMLPLAGRKIEDRRQQFARLLARLRGTVTLSYSCHDLAADCELLPSSSLMEAFRLVAGKPEADLMELQRHLPAAASFAPENPTKVLDGSEWWLWRLTGPEIVENSERLVAEHFPHLGRGFEAACSRSSDLFTFYDGWLAARDAELDPTSPAGPVMSAARLEKLGACPLAYFFMYVLDLKEPQELTLEPGQWLTPILRGSLMHRVFEQFLRPWLNKGPDPAHSKEDAWPVLKEILNDAIMQMREDVPPPSESAFEAEVRQLEAMARIFLHEEFTLASRGWRPRFLEVSLGMPAEGHGSDLDTADPVSVVLASGPSFRARGRIDRIDERDDPRGPALFLWDYKTGGSWKYGRHKPFWQGRIAQPYLYHEMARARLAAMVSPSCGADVRGFGFFFPSTKTHGERLEYSQEALADGLHLLDLQLKLAASGAYIATIDHKNDCTYCPFRAICGDVENVAAASVRKMQNTDNSALDIFRLLRPNDKNTES